jgi:hypothetical protein
VRKNNFNNSISAQHNERRSTSKRGKEDQLQKEVLVPLFNAMGFKDVTIHQGRSELGKDIVMWKPGDLGERVNYAVPYGIVVPSLMAAAKIALILVGPIYVSPAYIESSTGVLRMLKSWLHFPLQGQRTN